MTQKTLWHREITEKVQVLKRDGRLAQEETLVQHGNASILEHSIQVALFSLFLVHTLRLSVDRSSLVRGALLHDYFLYDWHEPHDGHGLHGFTHPRTALNNAMQDYELTATEQDVIVHHMFPLTLLPPATREGWIVCLADKWCATRETLAPYARICRRCFRRLAA